LNLKEKQALTIEQGGYAAVECPSCGANMYECGEEIECPYCHSHLMLRTARKPAAVFPSETPQIPSDPRRPGPWSFPILVES
jgi:DNA-directed RNA polymerase subunit RPC12/RpoP